EHLELGAGGFHEEAFGHQHDGLPAWNLREAVGDALQALHRAVGHHPRLTDVEPRLLLDQVLDVAEAAFALAGLRIVLARLRAEPLDDFARAVGDLRRLHLVVDARPLAERREDRLAVLERRLHSADAGEQLAFVDGQAALVHAAVEEHAARVAGREHLSDEALGAGLDAHQRLVREVRFVEEHHEHAVRAVLGLVGVFASDRSLGDAQIVRHHEELLDLLRFAVLVDRDVVGLEAGHEAAVPVEHDRVHFDELGRRLERGLLASSLAERLGLRQREPAQHERNDTHHGFSPEGILLLPRYPLRARMSYLPCFFTVTSTSCQPEGSTPLTTYWRT